MPSYCPTYCSCLLTRAYIVDASSLYRRYYVLQRTAFAAEECGTKGHHVSCPKYRKQNTSLPKKDKIHLIKEQEDYFNQQYLNLQKRRDQICDAIGDC